MMVKEVSFVWVNGPFIKVDVWKTNIVDSDPLWNLIMTFPKGHIHWRLEKENTLIQKK